MKNKNLSWFAALLVFALLLWCTAATPGKIADPSTYTCAVYSTIFSLLPPVIAIVLALNTKEVYTSLLVGIASGALLYANGNLELAINTLFFNEDGGMVAKLSDSSNVLPLSGHSASRSTLYFWMNRSAIWMMITAASWANLSLPRQRHKEPV